jgi:hypothetical protein
MPKTENDKRRLAMTTRHRESNSPFSSIGEPQKGDVAITVLTALILLAVLVVVAVL